MHASRSGCTDAGLMWLSRSSDPSYPLEWALYPSNGHSTFLGPSFHSVILARPEGLEPPTTWFEARYSIQLSYRRELLFRLEFGMLCWRGLYTFGFNKVSAGVLPDFVRHTLFTAPTNRVPSCTRSGQRLPMQGSNCCRCIASPAIVALCCCSCRYFVAASRQLRWGRTPKT